MWSFNNLVSQCATLLGIKVLWWTAVWWCIKGSMSNTPVVCVDGAQWWKIVKLVNYRVGDAQWPYQTCALITNAVKYRVDLFLFQSIYFYNSHSCTLLLSLNFVHKCTIVLRVSLLVLHWLVLLHSTFCVPISTLEATLPTYIILSSIRSLHEQDQVPWKESVNTNIQLAKNILFEIYFL